jgi:hypothetical protein
MTYVAHLPNRVIDDNCRVSQLALPTTTAQVALPTMGSCVNGSPQEGSRSTNGPAHAQSREPAASVQQSPWCHSHVFRTEERAAGMTNAWCHQRRDKLSSQHFIRVRGHES